MSLEEVSDTVVDYMDSKRFVSWALTVRPEPIATEQHQRADSTGPHPLHAARKRGTHTACKGNDRVLSVPERLRG